MLDYKKVQRIVKERSNDASVNIDYTSEEYEKSTACGSFWEGNKKDFLTREDHITVQPNIFP